MILLPLLALIATQTSCATPEQFYQVSDGPDWEPAISRAIESFQATWPTWNAGGYGGCVQLGLRRYHVDHTIVIDRSVNFGGMQGGGWFSGSEIECNPALNPCVLLAGPWSYIHDLAVKSQDVYGPPPGHVGIEMIWRAFIERVYLRGFTGHCIYVHGGMPQTNVNGFQIKTSRIDNCGGDGISIVGQDASAGLIEGVDAGSLAGACYRDLSFLGNTYIANMAAACGDGSYVTGDLNARNAFFGNYTETDTRGPRISQYTLWAGGTPGQYPSGEGWIASDAWLQARALFLGPYHQLVTFSAYVPTSTVGHVVGETVIMSYPKPGGCDHYRLTQDGYPTHPPVWQCAGHLGP